MQLANTFAAISIVRETFPEPLYESLVTGHSPSGTGTAGS